MALIGAEPPGPFESEILFSDEFVCVVARDHPLRAESPTLESYAKIVDRMTWRQRLENDAAYAWFRQQLRDASAKLDG